MKEPTDKQITTRIDKEFHKFVNQIMINEDEFPFKNFKLFLELGGFRMYQEWLEVKDENSKVKMAHFSNQLRDTIEKMIKKGLLEPNFSGWK